MLNSTKCPCGQELRNKRFDKMTPRKFDDRFYGGRVVMEGTIKCECGRELKGYFEQSPKTDKFELIDLEVIKDITLDKKIDLNETSCVDCEAETPKIEETKKEIVIDDTEDNYIAKTYEEMDYNELRKIAKEKGIKTNQKREVLIQELMK